MASYSFSLSASWWLLALCGIAAAALSWYAYSVTTPPISPARRFTLMALRLLGLWILLFALFEPIVNVLRATEEPPSVAILLDNSESLSLRDASRDRKADYLAALKALKPETLNDALPEAVSEITLFANDASTVPAKDFVPDSMRLDGQFTNITKPLQRIFQNAERTNTQAVLLVTDGAFNEGENPLYAAEMLARPMVIVGVGDSTEAKDIAVRSVITNEVGYVDSELPVNITVQSSGFTEGAATLVLRDNGETVAEQTLPLRGTESRTVSFVYKPKQAGMHTLTAEIKNQRSSNQSGLEGELTTKNNAYSEFVNVLKNKRKTLVLAAQLSPDISFIRSSLEANSNVQCNVYVEDMKGGFLDNVAAAQDGKPLETSPKRTLETLRQDLADAEAIVLVGFPLTSTPLSFIEVVKTELSRGKPVLFVASQDLDWVRLRPLEPFLPFTTLSGSKQEMLALPDVKQPALASPVMKLSGTDADLKAWNQLPPLFRTETLVRVKPEAEVLSTVKLNNVPLAEPLLVQRTLNNTKSLAILGYGLYRWKLLGFAAEAAKGREVPDIFGTFFENGLRWLSTSDQGKFVRIKSSRKVYGSGESVELTAQVYDRSYNPLDGADVRVTLQSSALKQAREVVLSALGGGRYAATVEGLGEGEYSFVGTAAVNNQKYGEDSGRFSVGRVNIEYQNLRMNAVFLRRLAESTGGQFFTAEEVAANPDAVRRAIQSSPNYKARPITLRSDIALWNLAWLLAAALVMFAAEWFLRKRSGMV
ncbi:MAG: hypothetical protein MUF71_06680 [Candidatus Kapabacteria bacterium]|jgi:hypothetical protein|nr:hypothetical protein [Candidatus Kapabacteria bacterium]